MTLSQWIAHHIVDSSQAHPKNSPQSTAQTASLNGVDTIQITNRFFIAGRGGARFDWWIDPKRGYALLRDEYHVYDKDHKVIDSDRKEILKLVEAAPGVWYPSEAFNYFRALGGKDDDPQCQVALRSHYTARAILANHLPFDATVFDVPIPAGRLVTDQDTGITSISGPPAGKLDTGMK
jgi:hypothetical protein